MDHPNQNLLVDRKQNFLDVPRASFSFLIEIFEKVVALYKGKVMSLLKSGDKKANKVKDHFSFFLGKKGGIKME